MDRRFLALAAYVAAFVFFLILALDGTLGDTNLVAAGLASLAAGHVIDHLP